MKRSHERALWVIAIATFLMAAVAFAGTFTSYNDISALQDTDELLLFDDSEGSGDQLANMTIANFRATLGALFSGDIDAGAFSADAIDMDDLDEDTNYTDWTGNWATTGTLSGGSLAPVAAASDDFAANFTGANLYGGTFVATSDGGDAQLPEMAAGMNFCIITVGAIQVVVASHANDGYLLDGTDTAEDNSVVNASTAGDIACFQYYTADDWLITTNGWTTE